jgi:ribosomal protein L29
MEFKTASVEELETFVNDKRKELRDLRFSAAGSKNRNVKLTSMLRKEIARAMTAISGNKKKA